MFFSYTVSKCISSSLVSVLYIRPAITCYIQVTALSLKEIFRSLNRKYHIAAKMSAFQLRASHNWIHRENICSCRTWKGASTSRYFETRCCVWALRMPRTPCRYRWHTSITGLKGRQFVNKKEKKTNTKLKGRQLVIQKRKRNYHRTERIDIKTICETQTCIWILMLTRFCMF